MSLPRLGPLSKIVNVHWGSSWLALGVTAGGANSTTVPSARLTANGKALGDIFQGPNTDVLKTSPVFKRTTGQLTTDLITFTNVEMQFSGGVWGPLRNWIRDTEQSPDALPKPFVNGTWNGVGSIQSGWVEGFPSIQGTSMDEVIAALHASFGSTTAPLRASSTILGPFTVTSDTRAWSAHVVAYVNLGVLKTMLRGASAVTVAVTLGTTHGGIHGEAYTFKFNPMSLPLDSEDTVSAEFDERSIDSAIDDETTTVTFNVNIPQLTVS